MDRSRGLQQLKRTAGQVWNMSRAEYTAWPQPALQALNALTIDKTATYFEDATTNINQNTSAQKQFNNLRWPIDT